MELSEKLSSLSSRFSDNLLDATNAFAHFVARTRTKLKGIPDDVLQAAAEAAKAGRQAWLEIHAACAVVPSR